MTIFWIVLLAVVLAFACFAIWVRVAPITPGYWHVDPQTAPNPISPNFSRADHVTSLSPAETAAAINAQAQSEGARVIAGDWPFITYLARTRLMGYPDFVTFKLSEAEGGGTHVLAFSRSRFGHSDMGVNRARLRRWIPD